MTILDNGTRNQYTATGGQTVFIYDFEIFATGDIVVYRNTTLLSFGTDYTLTGVGDDNGGTVVLTAGATAGHVYTIFRQTTPERVTDYQQSGNFLAEEINNDLDRIWAVIQELETDQSRFLQTSEITQVPLPVTLEDSITGNYLRWKDPNTIESVSATTLPDGAFVATDYHTRVTDYAALRALNTADLVNGQVVKVTNDGIAGDFIIRNSVAHGLTDNGGTIIVIDADWYAERVVNSVVNIKWFAQGDGVTDDSSAISNALNSGYSNFLFPLGTYLIELPVVVTKTGGGLNIVCEQGVVIYSNIPAPSVAITIQGTIEAGSPLLADITEGDRTLTTNEALAVGDLFRIESSENWVEVEGGQYKKSEFARVAGISGSTITLEWPLYDGYSAATTTIRRVNAPRVSVTNLSMLKDVATGVENIEGLDIIYAQSVKLDRVTVKNFTKDNIEIAECFDVTVAQCETYGAFFGGEPEGYGLAIIDCQNVNVYGGVYVGGRHGITTGGDRVCRNLVVDGVTTSSDGAKSLDTHSNQANVVVKNSDIRRGLSIFVQSAKVFGNTIRGDLQVQPVKSGGSISIYDNDGQEGTLEVATFTDVGPISSNYLSVKDNRYETSDGFAFRLNTSVQATDDWNLEKFDLKDNYFKTTDAGVTAAVFQGNLGNISIGSVNVVNNEFFSDSGKAFEIFQSAFDINNLAFNDNKCETGSSAVENTTIQMSATFATSIKACGNKFTEGVHGLLINCFSGNVFLDNNVFKDCDESFTTISTPNFTELQSGNNYEINVANGWGSFLDPRAVQDPGQQNVKRVVWRSGVPTTGTWKAGSRVYDNTPSPGGTVGWVCTASGTPGTWKTFGNIAP